MAQLSAFILILGAVVMMVGSGWIVVAPSGPACAITCAAGTVFRNYFVPIAGQLGQTAAKQIDCLDDIGSALGNSHRRLWRRHEGRCE